MQRSIIWFSITVVAVAATIRTGLYRESAFFVEVAIYLLVIWGTSRLRSPRELFLALDPVRRAAVLLFLGLLLVGQLADRPNHTYPFVNWTMYTNQTGTGTTFPRYEAVLAGGETMDLPLDKVASSTFSGMLWKLNALDHYDSQQSPDAGALDPSLFEATVRSIARQYNRDHPENPIRLVRTYLCDIPMDAYEGPDSVHRTLRREVTVER